MDNRIPVLAVVGPTASGKTSLGISLAQKYDGEIVSCDSMQIYRGLEIGTAKPTREQMQSARHHLIDFCDPQSSFSVSDYVDLADKAASDIYQRGKKVVLVGGTGLYARSFLRGIIFEESARSDELRAELIQQAENGGMDRLYDMLRNMDPESAEAIHPNNRKRVLRALEYCILTGEPFSEQARRSKEHPDKYRYLMIVLSFRDRSRLYSLIDSRVDEMMEKGLLEEAGEFYKKVKNSDVGATASQAIGYKELFSYFDGETSLQEAVENIKKNTRRYAKRQLTWFGHEKEKEFLYVDDYSGSMALYEAAVGLIESSGIFRNS